MSGGATLPEAETRAVSALLAGLSPETRSGAGGTFCGWA